MKWSESNVDQVNYCVWLPFLKLLKTKKSKTSNFWSELYCQRNSKLCFKRVFDFSNPAKNSEPQTSVASNSLWPCGLYSPLNSPGQKTGVGSLFLLQGIFQTQGLDPGLPHCRQFLYQLSHKERRGILEWVASPFSRDLSNKQIHRHWEQTCRCQGRGGKGGLYWELGINICKLLYIEWIKQQGPTV